MSWPLAVSHSATFGGGKSSQFERNWTGDYLTGAYAPMLSLSFAELPVPSLDRVAALSLSQVASLAVLLARPNRGHSGAGTVVFQ